MSYIKGKRVKLSTEPTEESLAFAEYCRDLFEYKEDGTLIRKISRGGNKAGTTAGSLDAYGYFVININSTIYKLHQIIFLLHHNYIAKVIDHIDRNKINNRIENLRSVTTRENNLNTARTSETPNIFKKGINYQVLFEFNGKQEYFGIFKTLEEAASLRDRIVNDLDNWLNYLPKKRDKSMRYISKSGDGFRIQKRINGTNKYFGIYKTLEEAIVVRDKLEANNWEKIT